MTAFVDRIFTSYMTSPAAQAARMTKEQWLDGRHGWRKPLREIGKVAARLANHRDTKAARADWNWLLNHTMPWMYDYIIAVALLDRTARAAALNDDVFRQFMKDLATLAEL